MVTPCVRLGVVFLRDFAVSTGTQLMTPSFACSLSFPTESSFFFTFGLLSSTQRVFSRTLDHYSPVCSETTILLRKE